MKISISTLAKSFNLSDEALRYYERKGLLSPARTNDSGYRSFERIDIQRVANIKRLQNQDFSLEEIRQIYTDIGTEDMLDLTRRKLSDLTKEIRLKQLIAEKMALSIERIESGDRRPAYAKGVPVYMMVYDSIADLWDHVAGNEALRKLFCGLPISSFTTIIGKGALIGEDVAIKKGVLIDRAGAEALTVDLTGFRAVDATHAVICPMAVENGAFDLKNVLPAVRDYMQAHRLTATDDLFTVHGANYNLKKGGHVHYTDLYVPIAEVIDSPAENQ